MPFTVSHAAAAIPLARGRMAASALVIGTVVPDLPYYLPFFVDSHVTHGPLGLVLVDVPVGLAVFALLHRVLRAPLTDLAPASLRSRLASAPSASAAPAAVVLSVAAGAATHLLWDSFTQAGGFVVGAWPLLGVSVAGPHRLFNVVMYASSVGGLAVLAWWAARWYRRAPAGGAPARGLLGGSARYWVWAGIAVAAVVGAVLSAATPRAAVSGYDFVRCVLLGLVRGVGAGAACHVALWHSARLLGALSGGGRLPLPKQDPNSQ